MSGFAVYTTRLGPARIDYEDGAVTGLKILAEPAGPGEPNGLTELVWRQLEEYLDGARRGFDFPMEPRGTDFQRRVWAALGEIPYGETRSYGDIARAIGRPKAARAVGAANGKNPVWIAVPCHRVVGSGGRLTGYAGGLELKQKLLELEGVQC